MTNTNTQPATKEGLTVMRIATLVAILAMVISAFMTGVNNDRTATEAAKAREADFVKYVDEASRWCRSHDAKPISERSVSVAVICVDSLHRVILPDVDIPLSLLERQAHR